MTDDVPLRVAIVGCGLIGTKRAGALGHDTLVGTFDRSLGAAEHLATAFGGRACRSMDELLATRPEVVVVAVLHRDLPELACAALEAGSHVLVEKPVGISVRDVDRVIGSSERNQRLVKVGFNHRFHPGITRAVSEACSGHYGEILSLRARYGHGGRLGYDREWRTDPALSGGGEIVDQGIHLLDISHCLLGDLPLHSSLLRTQFWDAPVDDNAVLILGEQAGVGSSAPFSLLSVSWTDWKNTFSLEIACRTAKFAVDGLVRSYGPQVLRIFRMREELGPPDLEEVRYPDRDLSWELEWAHFRGAIVALDGRPLLGDLASARYAWSVVEAAQGASSEV